MNNKYENELLKYLSVPYKIYRVYINKNLYINTLEISDYDQNKPIFVMIHGYACGLGIYYNIYEILNKIGNVYAIDLLGFGGSSKINYTKYNNKEIDNIFIETIEQWRIKMNLKKIILCGHSLGSYIITNYSIKYPNNIELLILLDPWGFEYDTKYDIIKYLPKINPMEILKISGIIGYILMFIFGFITMNTLFINEKRLNYLYNININNTSDVAFIKLIDYMAKPINFIDVSKINNELKIIVIYGKNSFINNKKSKLFFEKRNKNITNIITIPNIGHQVYLDKSNLFDNLLIKSCKKMIIN